MVFLANNERPESKNLCFIDLINYLSEKQIILHLPDKWANFFKNSSLKEPRTAEKWISILFVIYPKETWNI